MSMDRAAFDRAWRDLHARWRRVFFDHSGPLRDSVLDGIEKDMRGLRAKAKVNAPGKRTR